MVCQLLLSRGEAGLTVESCILPGNIWPFDVGIQRSVFLSIAAMLCTVYGVLPVFIPYAATFFALLKLQATTTAADAAALYLALLWVAKIGRDTFDSCAALALFSGSQLWALSVLRQVPFTIQPVPSVQECV